MKKALSLTLALNLFAASAHAEGPLEFSARIQSEELAEEAIDLLHCVSDRLGLPWELGEGAGAAYQLSLRESAGRLTGSFVSPAGEKPVAFGLGEAGKTCELLAPEEKPFFSSAPALPADPEPAPEKKTWLWVGAGALLLVGGFLLWKSGPDHRSLRME